MRVLLDTNVLSELRKPNPNGDVVRRVSAVPRGNAFMASITLGEIVRGVHRMPLGRKRLEYEQWLDDLEAGFADRILPFDREAARAWGILTAASAARGRSLPVEDSQIAAIARHHDLTVVTRNTADFSSAGIRVINPWTDDLI